MSSDKEIDELLGPAPPPVQADAAVPVAALVPAATGAEKMIGPYDGADRFNNSLALWAPPLQSADADMLWDKPTIDARARDTIRNDAYVHGGANIHRDNIVGSMFMLNAKPATKVLFGREDEKWEAEFQEEVEEKFDLYAESSDNWIDASRHNNFTSLVRMAVGIHVAGGEVLASAEWMRDFGRPYSTAIQMIEAERLSTPPQNQQDKSIRAGIRRDRFGAPLSYFIRQAHPTDWIDPQSQQWKEIPARKPWGRLQIIHLYEQTRPDQTRGIAEMAAALKEMRITKKFRDITLQNAATQALYAAAITSELPSDAVFQQLGGGQLTADTIQGFIQNYALGYFNSINEFTSHAKNLQIDGVRIPHLYPGTKLEMISPGKGGPLGSEFESSLLRYIAAILGVSYEQLSRDYTKTNYSSARAAMTETWKFMQARKKLIADRFASIIYRLWLEEALNKGLITSMPRASRASGWLYEAQRLDAISRGDWIGASRGQIDELKETQAAVMRINNNLGTAEDELGRLGRDWRKVFRQRARERAMMTELELPLPEEMKTSQNQENATAGAGERGANADG